MSSAEERKKRFLEAKKQAGGKVDELIVQEKARPYKLFFKDSGEITCITKEVDSLTAEKLSTWKSWDFPSEKILEVLEHGYNKFRVVADDHGGYHIELRPISVPEFAVDDNFVSEITAQDEDADIVCEITKTYLRISISDEIKQEYKDVFPISATRKGIRVLKFFITEPHDPHIVYYYKTVLLGELLVNDVLELELGHDFRNYSLFTKKLFDTYKRIDKDG